MSSDLSHPLHSQAFETLFPFPGGLRFWKRTVQSRHRFRDPPAARSHSVRTWMLPFVSPTFDAVKDGKVPQPA
jgi:hypothetical protein